MKLGETYSLPPSCIFLLCGTKMARYRPNLSAFHTPASFPPSLLIASLGGVTWTEGEAALKSFCAHLKGDQSLHPLS